MPSDSGIFIYKQLLVSNTIEYIMSEGNYRNTFTKQNVTKTVRHRHISPSATAKTYKY